MKNSHRKIKILKDRNELISYSVKQWVSLAGKAIGQKNRFVVALSGGKTPVDFYRKLSVSVKSALWNKTHVFIVDERFVSFSHSQSNFRMIKQNLLAKVNIPDSNIHPIAVEPGSLISTAKRYEGDLKSFFRSPKNRFPRFDLLILGIGEDGHTASLFSKDDIMRAKNKWVVPVQNRTRKSKRITLTLPVINNAADIIFLLTGRNKADVLKSVWEGDKRFPASLVRPKQGNVSFFVDRPAASKLAP